MLDLVTATEGLIVGAWQFVTILLLIFGVFLILAGLFTSYFGSGKSRTIGVVLLVVGIVVGLLIGYTYSHVNGGISRLIWESFLVIIAAVIGALAAIAIFLVAIMKS
jgi:hypothetical protein